MVKFYTEDEIIMQKKRNEMLLNAHILNCLIHKFLTFIFIYIIVALEFPQIYGHIQL